MSDKPVDYRRAKGPLPDRNLLWPLYGAGFENLGRDGQPIEVPMPEYGPDELLVRHDACGLCFSDLKVIRLGQEHPRIYRDMRADPVVLGHEVSLTVVGVGEHLRDQYHVGDRFIMQADIYVGGIGYAYGYEIQGGLSQYNVVDQRVLAGDGGCYLIPLQPQTGYAEAALTEPWACVEAAYTIRYREGLRNGGVTWFLGGGKTEGTYRLSRGMDEASHPCKIVTTNLSSPLADLLRQRAEALGIERVALDSLAPAQYDLAVAETDGLGFDDIVVLSSPDPAMVEEAAKHLAKGGILNVVAPGMEGKVHLDVGRLHYDHITFVGTMETDIVAAYQPIRSKLLLGGIAWILGAAGPMGHMHVQRAVEMEGSPRKIVATNLRSPRIVDVKRKFNKAAQQRGIELVCLTQEKIGKEAYYDRLWEESEGRGFDDIVVLAPSAEAIERAAKYLAPEGVMNIFAGLPRGTKVAVDLSAIRSRGIRFIGSSGSTIEDLRRMLNHTESGVISPNRSVAAIAGIEGALDGLQAVAEGRFPGKVVIFPQITDLSLAPLSELGELLPDVCAKLGEGQTWTREAEEELLASFL